MIGDLPHQLGQTLTWAEDVSQPDDSISWLKTRRGVIKEVRWGRPQLNEGWKRNVEDKEDWQYCLEQEDGKITWLPHDWHGLKLAKPKGFTALDHLIGQPYDHYQIRKELEDYGLPWRVFQAEIAPCWGMASGPNMPPPPVIEVCLEKGLIKFIRPVDRSKPPY